VYLAKFLARSQRVLDYIAIAGWWFLAIYFCTGFLILHSMWQVSYVVKYLIVVGEASVSAAAISIYMASLVGSLVSYALRCDRRHKFHIFLAMSGIALFVGFYALLFYTIYDDDYVDYLFFIFIALHFLRLPSVCLAMWRNKNYDIAKTQTHLISPVFSRMFDVKYVGIAAVISGIVIGLHVTDAGRRTAFYDMAMAAEHVRSQTDFKSMREDFDRNGVNGYLPDVMPQKRMYNVPYRYSYETTYIFPKHVEEGAVAYRAVVAGREGFLFKNRTKNRGVEFDFAACKSFAGYWQQFLQANKKPYGFLLRGVTAGSYYEEHIVFFKQPTAAGDVIVLLRVYSPNMRSNSSALGPRHCR